MRKIEPQTLIGAVLLSGVLGFALGDARAYDKGGGEDAAMCPCDCGGLTLKARELEQRQTENRKRLAWLAAEVEHTCVGEFPQAVQLNHTLRGLAKPASFQVWRGRE